MLKSESMKAKKLKRRARREAKLSSRKKVWIIKLRERNRKKV